MEDSQSTPEISAVEPVLDLIRGRRVVVLAGAGCSTESGIPDYRGPEGIRRSRRPMQYQEFMRSEAARIRYWARSTIGWPNFAAARPNAAHLALASLEESGAVSGLITQNVDGLHQAAGSRRVVELHGRLSEVVCLECKGMIDRSEYQEELLALNPGWIESVNGNGAELAPDGDAELPAEAEAGFRVLPCPSCRGVLKPNVVFFGENVPTDWVAEAWNLFGEAEVLLVAGSSLTVYSGRRFIYRAVEEGVPIAIVNLGETRVDEMAAARVEGRVGELLPMLVRGLQGENPSENRGLLSTEIIT